jgi:hypothetical protein
MSADPNLIPPIGTPLRSEDLPRIVEAAVGARTTLQRAMDFVILHEDYTVNGPSPASSLNEPTVLAAVAGWERFIGDLTTIALRRTWLGSGLNPSTVTGSYLVRPGTRSELHDGSVSADQTVPGDAARVVVGLTGSSKLLDHLHVKVVHNWVGARPDLAGKTGMPFRPHGYLRAQDESVRPNRLTVAETLYQAVKLRNAIAHSFLPRMGGLPADLDDPTSDAQNENAQKAAPPEQHWLDGPRELFWFSDKKDGLSVQAGCARGVLALFIQIVDQVIVGLALSRQAQQEVDRLLACRLPEEWFAGILPARMRQGLSQDVQLWRGRSLHRLEPAH